MKTDSRWNARKCGFSERMGAMLANPCHPYIQRGFVIVQLEKEIESMFAVAVNVYFRGSLLQ